MSNKLKQLQRRPARQVKAMHERRMKHQLKTLEASERARAAALRVNQPAMAEKLAKLVDHEAGVLLRFAADYEREVGHAYPHPLPVKHKMPGKTGDEVLAEKIAAMPEGTGFIRLPPKADG